MNKVTKAVIPVAGLGTRMLPATKAIPKEMLPIVDKPLIQYIVNECVDAGITEIVLVTHSSKNAIENHFDKSFELETTLEKRVKRQLLEEIQSICPKGVTIMHVRQGEAKGLGHAILKAQPLIGNEPFAVVLPDVLIDQFSSDAKTDNMAKMLVRFEQDGVSRILVEGVPYDQVSKYGIIDNAEILHRNDDGLINRIVEKPKVDEAPSNLAVVGRYVFSPGIWSCLADTLPGADNEIQLTDAIQMLLNHEPVKGFHINGYSHDCGSKRGYMRATIRYALQHPEIGEDMKKYIEFERKS